MKVAIWNRLSYFSLSLAVTIANPTAIQQQLTLSSHSPSDSEIEPIHSNQDTANFIFASFAGLLQQWPNTFAFSGHSIIPGVIPRNTLLYHGTNRREPPPQGMEWLAFNPEMSYLIHTLWDGPSDLYTYVSTRPLRVIYIDGQSASLGTPGFMDSQSVLINGTVNKEFGDEGHYLEAEYARAHELCKIGKVHGFEGVIRMNTGFELIWCDFMQGIEIVQVTNVTDPFSDPASKNPRPKDIPRMPHAGSPFWSRASWMNSQAASRQFFAPGEVRVKLDPTGFISFYDRLESLSLKRRADDTDQGPRSHHRLYGISTNDVDTIRDRFIKVLARKKAEKWQLDSDQLDWQGTVLTIIETYSQQLNHLQYVLKRNDLNAVDQAVEVRALSYGMIMPYVDFSAGNYTDATLASVTIQKCRTAFTSGIYHPSDLTESAHVIIGAIEGTLNRLCTTLYHIFSETMQMSLPVKPASRINSTLESEAKTKIVEWRNKTNDLIKWLGWSGHCNPSCKPNELCIIPMWPSVRTNLTSITNTYPVCQDFATWRNLKSLDNF